MWTFTFADNTSQHYIKGGILSVGRGATSNLTFASDKSISRNHAIIQLDEGYKLHVKDLKSKFGTFIARNSVTSDEESSESFELLAKDVFVEIPHGTTIRFGVFNSRIRVSLLKMTVCLTRLNKNEKTLMKSYMKTLSGSIVSGIDDARYLVTNSFVMTVKLLTAIILQKTIITMDWFHFLKDNNSDSLLVVVPDMNAYNPFNPNMLEPSQIQMLPQGITDIHQSRSHLLHDYIMILSSGTNKEYVIALQGCGAKVFIQDEYTKIDELIITIDTYIYDRYPHLKPTNEVKTITRKNSKIIKSSNDTLTTMKICIFYEDDKLHDLTTNVLFQHFNPTIRYKIPLIWLSSSQFSISVLQLSLPPIVVIPPVTLPTTIDNNIYTSHVPPIQDNINEDCKKIQILNSSPDLDLSSPKSKTKSSYDDTINKVTNININRDKSILNDTDSIPKNTYNLSTINANIEITMNDIDNKSTKKQHIVDLNTYKKENAIIDMSISGNCQITSGIDRSNIDTHTNTSDNNNNNSNEQVNNDVHPNDNYNKVHKHHYYSPNLPQNMKCIETNQSKSDKCNDNVYIDDNNEDKREWIQVNKKPKYKPTHDIMNTNYINTMNSHNIQYNPITTFDTIVSGDHPNDIACINDENYNHENNHMKCNEVNEIDYDKLNLPYIFTPPISEYTLKVKPIQSDINHTINLNTKQNKAWKQHGDVKYTHGNTGHTNTTSNSSGNSNNTRLRDVRKFQKNYVRNLDRYRNTTV